MRLILLYFFLSFFHIGWGQESLSNREIKNLHKLCKIWGFLKYYHPDVCKGKFDWDNQLLEQMPLILTSPSESEANRLLAEWIKSVGRVSKQVSYEFENEIKLQPPTQWIYNEENLGKDLSSSLSTLINAKRPKKNHYIKWDYGQTEFNENPYKNYLGDNPKINLLALFRYWNIIQYFYPYRYLTNDWDSVLAEYIPKFYLAKNSLEYKLLIKELSTEINDAHASTYDKELKGFFGRRQPAIDVRKIEEKYVVYRLLPGFEYNNHLRTGDIITHIDGVPISERISSLYKYVPASNNMGKDYGVILLVFRTNNDSIELSLEDERSITLNTVPLEDVRPQFLNIPSNRILDGNIGYFYAGSVKSGTVDSIFQSFRNTNGLVVDLRCYPSHYLFDMFKYISNEYDEYILGTSATVSLPGLFKYDRISGKVIANPNYYKNKIVLIVDELTLSQSESYAMAFQVNPKTMVIGSTTAGANGDVIPVTLPGNIITVITSWGAYYPDGREMQGIGIIPEKMIRPTIEGLKSGKDELLEYGIHLLKSDN